MMQGLDNLAMPENSPATRLGWLLPGPGHHLSLAIDSVWDGQ